MGRRVFVLVMICAVFLVWLLSGILGSGASLWGGGQWYQIR